MQDIIPVRPAFWNVPLWAEVGVYIIGLAALIVCIAGIIRSVRLRRGKAPNPDVFPDAAARTKHMIKEVFWQPRIREDGLGWMHFWLFWGFLFLFWGTAVATLDWDVAHLVFGTRILKGSFYLVYKLILDAAGLFALIALAFAAWRRFGAHDVRVRVEAQVKAVAAGRLDAGDRMGVFQKAQIAVDRGPADLVVLTTDVEVDVLGGGVVVARAHRVEHERALLGVPALHRHGALLFN